MERNSSFSNWLYFDVDYCSYTSRVIMLSTNKNTSCWFTYNQEQMLKPHELYSRNAEYLKFLVIFGNIHHGNCVFQSHFCIFHPDEVVFDSFSCTRENIGTEQTLFLRSSNEEQHFYKVSLFMTIFRELLIRLLIIEFKSFFRRQSIGKTSSYE